MPVDLFIDTKIDVLRDRGTEYVRHYRGDDTVHLDGDFSITELEQIITKVRERQ